MLKAIAATAAAATIAATITVIGAPIGDVHASPLPQPTADTIAVCKNPWPYTNCMVGESGNARIRVIRVDSPSS